MEDNKTLTKGQEVEIKVFSLIYKYLLNIKVAIKIGQGIDHYKDIKNLFLMQTFYLLLI